MGFQEDPRETTRRSQPWWKGASCPSCTKGFNSRSKKKQCHQCDKYTHMKAQCVSAGDDSAVFICKACKLTSNDTAERSEEVLRQTADDGFKCKGCKFRSAFKYNLKRHIDNHHGGIAEPIQKTELIVLQEIPEVAQDKVIQAKKHTIGSLLGVLGLDRLKTLPEGVDMEMLLSLNRDDLKDCLKDVGVLRFGDRHKISEKLLKEKRNSVETAIGVSVNHSDPEPENISSGSEMTADVDILEKDIDEEMPNDANVNMEDDNFTESPSTKQCELCDKSKHPCQKCGKHVCNLFCSIPDPSSDNEMYRIHKPGDSRCVQEAFECPLCSKLFATSKELQEHVKIHAHESSTSLISVANSSEWMYVKCTQCDKKFENGTNMNHHLERVHEYGESCLIYPCEYCGFRAADIQSMKDHVHQEHDCENKSTNLSSSVRSETELLLLEEVDKTTSLTEHSLSNILVSTRIVQDLLGVDFDDDSDEDIEWTPTKDDEKLLEEDAPKPIRKKGCFSCDQC